MAERTLGSLFDTVLGSEGSESQRATPNHHVMIRDRYDPPVGRVDAHNDDPALTEETRDHLATLLQRDHETSRDLAHRYRSSGAGPQQFVSTHSIAVEAVVEAAFADLKDRADTDPEQLDATEAALTDALNTVFGSMVDGLSTFSDQDPTVDSQQRTTSTPNTPKRADGGTDRQSGANMGDVRIGQTTDPETPAGAFGPAGKPFPVGYEALLDHLGSCVFVLDTDGDIVFWNEGAEELTGTAREDAYEHDMASKAFYYDGRRGKTLADKVLEAPESADEKHGVPRVDNSSYTLYRDRSTMTNAEGEEVHISFSAAPIYDGDELVGVIEMVQDRTEDVVRRDRTADLVSEIHETMTAVQAGNYNARASFNSDGHVDEELLTAVEEVNDLASQFEVLAGTVQQKVSSLRDETETITNKSTNISASAKDQTETMEQLSAEVSNLSATVEQVAASATEVDATSTEAEQLAEDGQESAEEAVSLMHDVEESATDVAQDVDSLQGRIDEINDIVEVINEIADQTNLLALNASIEAARAGEAGEGFGVVADEVKQLAEESQQQASQIEALIGNIQSDTTETVENLTETTDRISEVVDQVEDAMDRLSAITDAVSQASTGIQEVSDAADEQAASTEEVAGMMDEAADQAAAIASDVEDIASANEELMERAEEIHGHMDQQSLS